MLSQGVPMMVMGDEARQTQFGNNNAYCQDNEITWFDWTRADEHADLIRFTSELIAFRKEHPTLRRSRFFTGDVNERGLADISWHGCRIFSPGWDDPESRVLAFTLAGFPDRAAGKSTDTDIHVMMNMDWDDLDFDVPKVDGRRWYRAIDTGAPAPERHPCQGARAALGGRHLHGQEPKHRGAHLEAVTTGTAIQDEVDRGGSVMAVKTGSVPAKATAKTAAKPKDAMAFSFADTIAGYVKRYDRNANSFTMETSDGREFTVGLTDTTGAQIVRNLGEPYVDATAQMRDMLVPGRYLFTYGVFYPAGRRRTSTTPRC